MSSSFSRVYISSRTGILNYVYTCDTSATIRKATQTDGLAMMTVCQLSVEEMPERVKVNKSNWDADLGS